jgi:hypothetical protein
MPPPGRHDVDELGFVPRRRATPQKQPAPEEETASAPAREIEVKLIEAKWKPGKNGFQFTEQCLLEIKAEYLKPTVRKRVEVRPFVVFNGVEEDLGSPTDAFLDDKGIATAKILLEYGSAYYDALEDDPTATCQYKCRLSHSTGEREIESELLDMPASQKIAVDFVEIADIHFHHNCALPCLDEKGELISALRGAFSFAKEHTDRELVVAGHADRSGDAAYNLQISKRRAEAIKALLENDDALWKGVVDCDGHDQKIETEDYQQALKSLAVKYGWPCDPGAVDNKYGPKTGAAAKGFQAEYNKRFPGNEQLTVDGRIGPKSWQALFHTLRDLLDKALKSAALDPPPALTYGYLDGNGIYPCGESSPVTELEKSEEDRRVELVFYKAGEWSPAIAPAAGRTVESKKDPVSEKAWEKKGIPQIASVNTFKMVELIEVVTQDKEKWVKGAAMETTEIADKIDRTDQDGSNFKQYINIDRDIEGVSKRHPEYGREIVFKARITQTDSKTDKLKDISIDFTYKRTDGPNRTNPGGSDPDVWKTVSETVVGDNSEGFKKINGDKSVTVKTDEKGWSEPVSFFVSMFGGDQFEIIATLAPDMPSEAKSKTLSTKSKYVAWRKFWYQMTYADGYNPPEPKKAETAYKEVFADMVRSSEKKFKKEDLPLDLQNRTFYKEYMLQQGGGNTDVATVGSNNKTEFTKKQLFDKDIPKEHPFKANLIICNYQCDAKDPCAEGLFKLKFNGDSLTMAQGSGGPIICKPPLKPGAKLVVTGEWSKKMSPWVKEGTISDGAVEIDSARGNTLTITVDLTKGATGSPPTPTVLKPIFIKLKVETGRGYLGESFGTGHILCVYRPTAAAGKQGSEVDFNDTVAHELGHMWNQTPTPSKQPDPMMNHPLQYVSHGGSGSHCRFGVTKYEQAATFTAKVEPETTISKTAAVASDTHEVVDTQNFNKDYTVKVNGVEKVIKSVVDSTHLKFTTAFIATTGEKVIQCVDWNDLSQEWPSPSKGECVMFHSYSDTCKHVFCKTCKSYLQLQDMSKW